MDRNKLIENLIDLDEEAYLLFSNKDGSVSHRFEVLIVGSSSLIIRGLIIRATNDTDILKAPGQLLPLLEKYHMNMRVVAYLDSFPYNYEDRLERLPISGRIIDYYSPSLEDLIVSKLYRNEAVDLEDFKDILASTSLDWELLEKLVYDENEARASMMALRRYAYMVDAYRAFKEEYLK